MKRSSTVFLQVVVILFAIGTLALLLWEPHIEGRNAQMIGEHLLEVFDEYC